MRATTVKPLGLLTAPNKHGLPPGAMSRALNVCMREIGVVSSLPDVRTYRADVGGSGNTIRRLFPGASSQLAVLEASGGGSWFVRWVSSSASSLVSEPLSVTTTFSAGKTQSAKLRERTLLTNDTIVPWLFDSEGSTTPRHAGLPPPQIFSNGLSNTNAQALETAKVVAYRAILRREHSDGYETISAPSEPLHVTNSTGSTQNVSLKVYLPGSAAGTLAIAGDIVEIYRSDARDAGSDPGDTLKLAVSYVLEAADITAREATVVDNALESSLTAELYSNPNQDTIQLAKMPPPLASDVAAFRGRMFYCATRLRSSIKLKIPGPTGDLSTAAERASGIGRRTFTGDISNGSADIANVSDTTGLAIGQSLVVSGSAMNGATITGISGTTVTASIQSDITSAGHSVSSSDTIVINGTSASMSTTAHPNTAYDTTGARIVYDFGAVSQVFTAVSTWTITWPSTFVLENVVAESGDLTVKATNGSNYFPPIPDYSDTAADGSSDPRTNRYASSLDQQPEAVSPEHYGFIGAGTNYRMIPTRDALYFFCSDGLYRLTGDAFPWQVDPVDPTLVLSARNAVDVLGDAIWAYTNRGLVAIENDTVREVSTPGLGDAATLPGAAYSDTWDTFLVCDELHREVWLTFRSGSNSVSYVHNTFTGAFTTVDDDEWSCMTYSRALQSLVIGAVSSNPDVLYFESDTSATRMPGADLRFHPFTMGDPFTLKEFVDVDYLFEGASGALTLVPTFDSTAYASVAVIGNAIEAHAVVPVPRNAPAVARRVAPGFTLSSGGTAQRWSLRGLSVRWEPAAEEAGR